jgi:hypothetical protein
MNAITFLKGLGLGAGLMYLYDPQLGRRRRKLALDQFHHAMCQMSDAADVTWRDASNRLQGCVAEFSSPMRAHDNSDDVVHDRVRSKLGRYVSHPSAIGVTVREGHVVLSGPILAEEVEPLVHCLRGIHGVRGVENRLDVHETPGNMAALQGGRRRPGESYDILQNNWSPSTRCLIGSLGGAMLLSSARSRGPLSLLKGAMAACMIGSAITRQTKGQQPSQRGAPSRSAHTSQGNGGETGERPAGESSRERESAGLQARSGPT